MRMSDLIEAFIKDQLSLVDENEVELKRNEVAERFKCAPSQINYVLSTRFTRDNGYIIESRRGGGGYIRIVRVVYPRGQKMLDLVQERIGDSIDELRAGRIIDGLAESGYVSQEEAAMMRGAISAGALSVPMHEPFKDNLRANILKGMLTGVARLNREHVEDTRI